MARVYLEDARIAEIIEEKLKKETGLNASVLMWDVQDGVFRGVYADTSPGIFFEE